MPILALVIIVIVSVATGFGGGWAVKGWKDGATVAVAKSGQEVTEVKNSVLESANSQCEIDVDAVNKGVQAVHAFAEARAKKAEAAAVAAQAEADMHKRKASMIIAAPIQDEDQCALIIKEQESYLADRENGK